LRQLLIGLTRVKGPKTVILLTEGLYLDGTAGQIAWVGETAAAARASMYAVVLDDTFADMDTSSRRISPTTNQDRRLRQEGVDTLVGLARGSAEFVSSGAQSAFEKLSRELTGYYLLGFEPEPTERDGKPHNIRVKVKRPGVQLRARRSFTVDAPPTAARPSEEVLTETLRDPLLATEVRLRVATYSFPDPSTGKVRLLMSTGLGLPADDAPVVGVAYRVMDSDGNLVAASIEPVGKRTAGDHRWNGAVVVAPGTYMLKVAAVDSDGRRGSVEHRLTAGLTSAGALKLGDLMLSESGATTAEGLKPEIEPRVTAAGVEGYLEVASEDATGLTSASATLEIAGEPNGPALVSAPLSLVETKAIGRRAGQAQVALADLPPGTYVARAVVALSGRPVGRVLREFSYAPSAEVRARSTGGATSLTLLRLSFEPKSVLAGDVLTRMLQSVAQKSPSGAVASAVEQAGRGEAAQIPDLLTSGGDDPAAALLRGIGFYARGDLEPAANEFRRALRADSELTAAAFYLGACYAAGGRDREAVGAWQTTLAAETLDPAVFSLTAEAYLRLKDWPAAIDVAKEAASEWPDDMGVQRQLIRAQALGGQRREALQAIDGFLTRQSADHEIALLGMKLVYDGAADGRPVAAPRDDLARYDRYLTAYRSARGPEVPLAERWRTTVAARAGN
jgi:tetratricopeptide (TPR) repeat protein